MSDTCTIFCLNSNLEQIISIAKKNTSGEIEVISNGQTWEKIVVTNGGHQLSLSNLFRKEPGDKFSKLILSTHNHFRNIETTADAQKQLILNHVTDTQAIIGVVGEPTFSESDHHFELIFGIAKDFNGIIFNGNEMLDDAGYIILSNDGTTELEAF